MPSTDTNGPRLKRRMRSNIEDSHSEDSDVPVRAPVRKSSQALLLPSETSTVKRRKTEQVPSEPSLDALQAKPVQTAVPSVS